MKSAKSATKKRVEGEVLYRKEGSKIVPVVTRADDIDAPVSALFAQFEDFAVKPSSSPAPPPMPVKGETDQEFDLTSLTITDVLPPDTFVQQFIKQKKFDITLEELKSLVQGLIDVLPLPEKDPKRIQAEKEFLTMCKKRKLNMNNIAEICLKLARDGSPLAFAIFKIATEHGDVVARYSYGVMLYRGGKGVPQDKAQGRAIIEALATPDTRTVRGNRGMPWAQVTIGGIYARDDQDFHKAKYWYKLASDSGVNEAQIALGRMYLSGELPRNVALAKKYFQAAASTGPAGSKVSVSTSTSTSSESKTESGSGSGAKASQAPQEVQEYAEAHFMLGALEMDEKPTPNYQLAFQHFQRAASKGLPEAQYNVGQAYFRGLGVPKNDALAIEYWKMSGQQGFGLAQLSLGAYYFQDEQHGQQDTTKDKEEEGVVVEEEAQKPKVAKHVWDPSKKDLMQAQKWFTLASRRPGSLGAEGARLKAQVDEAIRQSGGGRPKRDGKCTMM
ncbi:hypothetical protein BG004_008416 [Podila humilis]|nr:hypothetical protein BG004_008416 [Podila humilis]